MKEKTHTKLNISLPADLHAWVLKKQAEEKRKSKLSKTYISNIIADAVEQTKIREENERLLLQENVISKEGTAPTARSTSLTTYNVKTRRK
jgi:hypothetical protein